MSSGRQALHEFAQKRNDARQEFERYMDRNLIGSSPSMVLLRKQILAIGAHDGTVMISGETGTGKELVAEAIHIASGRRGRFVAVNCLALPAELFESEMFGSSRGSYTGSVGTKQGLFSYADNGTILLDEIDSLPHALQGKLLRVIQEKKVRKVGELKDEAINCRVIVATNGDLYELVEKGLFRSDLYYRLEMFSIKLDPLRFRTVDIPALVKHIISRQMDSEDNIARISPAAMERLQKHNWPGNIRELENVVVRSLVMNEVQTIEPEHILIKDMPIIMSDTAGMVISLPPEGISLEQIEAEALLAVQTKLDFDLHNVAAYFQTSVRTIQRRLSKIDRLSEKIDQEDLAE